MKTLQFVGAAHYRELSTADVQKVAERAGVDGKDLVGFKLAGRNARIMHNDFDTAEYVDLPDEVADWLLEWESADWKDVTKKAEKMQAEGQFANPPEGDGPDSNASASGAKGSGKKSSRDK